jgi:hypothetical protein
MAQWPNGPPARTLGRSAFLCLEFGLMLLSSAAATNLYLLLRGCRIRDIPLLFTAIISVDNFENQKQDKATDTEPNKPNIKARPTEQNISVDNIGVRPSFDAFDQVVPAGPPRHRLTSLDYWQ